MDLSRGPSAVRIEVRTSAAAELLLLIGAFQHGEFDTFELGARRFEALGEAAGPDLLARTHEAARGSLEVFGHLLGLVVESPPPADVAQFRTLVADMPPEELQLLLAGGRHRQNCLLPAPQLRRAIAGDPEAVSAARAVVEDTGEGAEMLEVLLQDAGALQAAVLEVIDGWIEVFASIEAEVMGPIERDAAARTARLEQTTPAELFEEATNGIQLSVDAGVRRVVLLPTYVFRPWVLLNEHDDAHVVAYPVADEHLDLDRATPPPHLVTTFKALGDEGRLRLLRRIAAGPITLKDAMEELGIAKSTAYHHLSVLRQSGLVLVNAEDNVYMLRTGQVPSVTDQLARYLGL